MENIRAKASLEIIAALGQGGVRHLIVEGFAVNAHGYERSTNDLDIWSDPSESNQKKLKAVLSELGFDTSPIDHVDLRGKSPVKVTHHGLYVDIMADLPGVPDFDAAYSQCLEVKNGGLEWRFVGYDDLIRSKEAARRLQDWLDIAKLKETNASDDKE